MVCIVLSYVYMLQGIKFYEPEVVGDTPEAVEFRGMQNLLASAQEHLGFRDGKQIFSAGGQVCPMLFHLSATHMQDVDHQLWVPPC